MSSQKRGGLLDVFIILLIVLSVVGICLRMQALQSGGDNDSFCRVRAVVKNLPTETADCLTEGESLYTNDGSLYGMVESIETEPARITVYQGDKAYHGVWEDGSTVDLEIWMTLTGSVGEDVFLRDGKHAVLLGEQVLLYGERCALSFLICEVDWE